MTEPGTRDIAELLRQQESLREVIESISGELQLRPLLTLIVERACELLGADRGTIGLVDEARGVVRTEAAYRMTEEELGAEMPRGVGLAGQVYQTQQPLLLDRYGDVDRPMRPRMLEDAVIGVPIFWRERMIGFFGLGAAPPRHFAGHDVEVLSLFAKHAAIAITNAQRYEQERRRIERWALIARVGRMITSDLRLEDLLQNAADAIHELLGYANVAIPLIEPRDPETMVLRIFGGHYREIMQGEYRLPITGGIMGAAARERRVQLVNDVTADPRHIPTPGAVGICAELAVPILLGDQVLGVLNVESGGSFSVEDAESLQIIADQLAVAIQNARLFDGTRRALEEMQLLYATSGRITTAMDIEEVVAAYLEQVAGRGRYACSVSLYPSDGAGARRAVVVHGRWSPADGTVLGAQRLSRTWGPLDATLDAGETVTIADVHTDARVSAERRAIQAREGRPAMAMIPLMARGTRIGLVVLSAPHVHDWPDEDLRPYQVTAAQLASAIESRRQQALLYERGQQLAVLEERQRLARELHDSVTQTLFSISLISQSISPLWHRDATEGERRLQRLQELGQSALAEMRALLAELRPAPDRAAAAPSPSPFAAHSASPEIGRVRRLGLAVALQHHVAEVAADGLGVELSAAGYHPQPPDTEQALYRIAQEALHNVVKHAQAQRVRIQLAAGADGCRLTVTDDGAGFTSTAASKGFGLHTMRERAEELGGTLQIRSERGRGTTVEAAIPREG